MADEGRRASFPGCGLLVLSDSTNACAHAHSYAYICLSVSLSHSSTHTHTHIFCPRCFNGYSFFFRFLLVANQHYLEDLSAVLPNLEEVDGYLKVTSCYGLKGTLSGFKKVVKVGGTVYFDNNKNVEVLDGTFLPNLQSARDVTITSNIKLDTMANVLPSLVNVTDKTTIQFNNVLTTMNGSFPAVVNAGTIQIGSNPELLVIDSIFGALVTVASGDIKFSSNEKLHTLNSATGFDKLESASSVTISGNSALLVVDDMFPSLTDIAAGITIYSNAKLQSVATSFGKPGSLTVNSRLSINSNSELVDISGLRNIKCGKSGGCQLSTYNNYYLEKSDVCGVWNTMSGTGPVRSLNNNCDGGYLPCFGVGGRYQYGIYANC